MKKPKPKCEVCGTTKDIFECSWDQEHWRKLCPEDWYLAFKACGDQVECRQLELFK